MLPHIVPGVFSGCFSASVTSGVALYTLLKSDGCSKLWAFYCSCLAIHGHEASTVLLIVRFKSVSTSLADDPGRHEEMVMDYGMGNKDMQLLPWLKPHEVGLWIFRVDNIDHMAGVPFGSVFTKQLSVVLLVVLNIYWFHGNVARFQFDKPQNNDACSQ